MKLKTFGIIRIFVAFALAAVVSIALMTKNIALSIAAVLVAMTALLILKSRVKEVIMDERTHEIGRKAISRALFVFMILGNIVALTFMFIGEWSWANPYFIVSQTITYTIFTLMILVSLFQWYYKKKYGEYDKSEKQD